MIPGSQKKILGAAERLGAPIKRIVLTHAHGDHIGSLDALAEALPDAEVIISTRDARPLAGDKSIDPGEPGDNIGKGSFPGAKTAPTRTVEPGEMIGSLEVIASPGHTPGHVALLDTRDRTLICGDAYSTLGGVATTAKGNWRFRSRPTRLGTSRPGSNPRRRCGSSIRLGSRRATGRSSRPRARGWTPRSLAGPEVSMPRRGLDTARVVQEAARIADAEGLDEVTLARVAAALGVRAPSLYNHVDGRAGLLRLLALRSIDELADALRDAAVGRAGAMAAGDRARVPRVCARAPGSLLRDRVGAGAGRR